MLAEPGHREPVSRRVARRDCFVQMMAYHQTAFEALGRVVGGRPDMERHARQWYNKIGTCGSGRNPPECAAEIVELRREGDRSSRRHAPTPFVLFECREQREQCFGVPPPQAFRLAGLSEPLERIRARRFQQPVARHWIAFG